MSESTIGKTQKHKKYLCSKLLKGNEIIKSTSHYGSTIIIQDSTLEGSHRSSHMQCQTNHSYTMMMMIVLGHKLLVS